MKIETSETPWSHRTKDDPEKDERQYMMIEDVQLEESDFEIVKQTEDGPDEIIEKLKEVDGDTSSLYSRHKRVKRYVHVALKPELKDQLLPYFFESGNSRSNSKYKWKRIFEGKHGRSIKGANDVKEFDYRGCSDLESKIDKVLRVYEEKDFESYESLIEKAKEKFRNSVQNIIQRDNRKLREQMVRSYRGVNDPLEDFTEDSAPDIREEVQEVKERISEIEQEIEEKVGHLKEERSELRSEIGELKDKMLQREIEHLRDNDALPDDELGEELLEAMRHTEKTPF